MARDREQREERQAGMLDLLRTIGVNTREHGTVTLGEWDTSESGPGPVDECRRFIREARRAGPHDAVRGLLLVGTMGNGKTQLAVSAIRELLEDPAWGTADVVFDNATTLMGELQDTYGGEGSALTIKRRRVHARVWVLDDLGSERPREDPARLLYEILNARALAPTIITSNHTPADIEKRHPEFARVVSRLGSAYFEGVRVQGADRRYRRAG